MIAELSRTYIKKVVKTCEPDFDELESSFSPEEITPETVLDCSYHIGFLDLNNIDNEADRAEDDFLIELTFMKNGYSCETENHQSFIDTIYCLRNQLVNHINYDQGIIKVSPNGFTIVPMDSATNIMIIKVQILIKFNVCFN